MTTPLQQAIFEELDKYTSIEIMRENAQVIADKVASKPEIETCSKTYVLRMIKRREDSSSKVSFKVEPPVTESEDEDEEESESFDEDDSTDWDFEEEEPELDRLEAEEQGEEAGGTIYEIIDAKAAKTLIVVPFRIAADWTGYEGFKLTEEETRQLVPVIRPLLIKYIPDLLGQYFPEILCVFVVLSVLGPKIKGYKQFQEDKQKSAIAQAKAEKSAKEAQEREQRRLALEEQERQAALARIPEEPKKPLTKEDAGVPSWNDPRRNIG